jgi:hypothetical protein
LCCHPQGELEAPEVLAVWAQAVGSPEADAGQFVRAWRALESLFEFEDFVDGAEPEAEGSRVLLDDDDDEALTAGAARKPLPLLAGAALADWEFASRGALSVLQPMVVASSFLAEPLADGDLSMAEVAALWAVHVGGPQESCSEAQFGALWLAVEDLFEEEEEEDEDEAGAGGAAVGKGDFTVLSDESKGKPVATVSKSLVGLKAEVVLKLDASEQAALLQEAEEAADDDDDDEEEEEEEADDEADALAGAALLAWQRAATSAASGSGGGDGPRVLTKAAAMACSFVAEPMADGDLSAAEVEALWVDATGGATVVEAAAFGRFWAAVDDLFDEEEDDEQEEAAPAGRGVPTAGLSGGALRDWRLVSAASGGGSAPKAAVVASAFVAGPVEDGDLSVDEVEMLWIEHVGAAAATADAETFGRFWGAIEDLFEEEEEEEEEVGGSASRGGEVPSAEDATADVDGSYAACRALLAAALAAVPRKGLDASEQQRDELAALCDALDRHPAQVLY